MPGWSQTAMSETVMLSSYQLNRFYFQNETLIRNLIGRNSWELLYSAGVQKAKSRALTWVSKAHSTGTAGPIALITVV